MNLNFTKESDNFYRIDNVGPNGEIRDYNVASLYTVQDNFIEPGSQVPRLMWKIFAGRIQLRYDPVASFFVNPGDAIDYIDRHSIGIRSMTGVNGALLTEEGAETTARTIKLTASESDDFERMLENEERIQAEDGGNWSALIKTFYRK